MSPRRRRQFSLSGDYYERKYTTKAKPRPKRKKKAEHDDLSAVQEVGDPDLSLEESESSSSSTNQSDSDGDSSSSSDESMPGESSTAEVPEEEPREENSDMPHREEEMNSDFECDYLEEAFPDEPLDDTGDVSKIFAKIARGRFKTQTNLEITDILFMVLNFYIRHNLTQTALEDLLKMLNVISGAKTFPETFSSFMTAFRSNPYNSVRVYFCTDCQFEYGTEAPDKNAVCPICGFKAKDFFIVIPIEPQLRDLVTKYDEKIQEYAQFIEDQQIADVNRGKIASKVSSNNSRKCLTISANTDGAAAYKCTTQKPLYPVFVTLNNLPPSYRFSKHNLIVGALWLSKGEPNTNLLFKYLCVELRKLHTTGVDINGVLYSVVLLQVNLDSVARCKVQNMKQYNGRFGCTYCLHPGETKGSGNSRCYPYKADVSKRKDRYTRELMDKVCKDGKEIDGVMGKTVFVSLSGFDVIESFPPDYMHCVLLGVIKQLWALWTESENHKKPFYIGNKIDDVDRRILAIRPPSSFPRYPRTLREYKKFKANEWEAILLHYLYPILQNILPQTYINHVMLLSTSIYQLLDPKLRETTVAACENVLNEFVKQFGVLYGSEAITYNVHLVGHIAEAVRNFGALYNFSLFPYESGNGMLLSFRSSHNKPVVQIERKYYLNKFCQHAQLNLNSSSQKWIDCLWSKKKPELNYDSRVAIDSSNQFEHDDDVTERSFTVHSRLHLCGIKLCSYDICQQFQFDDSWIQLNGQFYRIANILCDKNNTCYIAGQKVNSEKLFENIDSIVLCNETRIMKLNESIRQCISITTTIENQTVRHISKCKVRTQID